MESNDLGSLAMAFTFAKNRREQARKMFVRLADLGLHPTWMHPYSEGDLVIELPKSEMPALLALRKAAPYEWAERGSYPKQVYILVSISMEGLNLRIADEVRGLSPIYTKTVLVNSEDPRVCYRDALMDWCGPLGEDSVVHTAALPNNSLI